MCCKFEAPPLPKNQLLTKGQKVIQECVFREWTAVPHLAGTPADYNTAKTLHDTWKEQGLDPVEITSYDVLLSYPDQDDPNLITLLDENGESVYQSQRIEKILTPDQNHSEVVPPFSAYSATGDLEVTNTVLSLNFVFNNYLEELNGGLSTPFVSLKKGKEHVVKNQQGEIC